MNTRSQCRELQNSENKCKVFQKRFKEDGLIMNNLFETNAQLRKENENLKDQMKNVVEESKSTYENNEKYIRSVERDISLRIKYMEEKEIERDFSDWVLIKLTQPKILN